MIKVLFCGAFSKPAMSGYQRFHSAKNLPYHCEQFEQSHYLASRTRIDVAIRGPFSEQQRTRAKNDLIAKIAEFRPDVVWLEWPRIFSRQDVIEIKAAANGAKLVCFQDDNPFGRRRVERRYWEHFIDAIPQYDIHFVKRESDVVEFYSRGAVKVLMFTHGTFPEIFQPPPADLVKTYPVSFVGGPLDNRAMWIAMLQLLYRIELHVFGDKWHRSVAYLLKRRLYHNPVFAENYKNVIWRSDICLGLVSHSNLDEYTLRSFEIPASGGLLLAKATNAHKKLYNDWCEAVFFTSMTDCVRKIKILQRDNRLRARIANAGATLAHRADRLLVTQMAKALELVCGK